MIYIIRENIIWKEDSWKVLKKKGKDETRFYALIAAHLVIRCNFDHPFHINCETVIKKMAWNDKLNIKLVLIHYLSTSKGGTRKRA